MSVGTFVNVFIKVLSQLSIGGLIVSLMWISLPYVIKKNVKNDKPLYVKIILAVVCIAIYIITKIL